MCNIKKFEIKPCIYTGEKALEHLYTYQGKRIGVVTDAFMLQSKVVEKILQHIPHAQTKIYAEVLPDPSIDIIKNGAMQLAQLQPEIILAIGGGSPLDAAKGITAVLREIRSEEKITLIAIPTTSGSGSEVTEYAIVSDPINNKKYPLVSQDIIPDVAILAPHLVASAPPSITADTGMDVIAHALEAYVSPHATDFSDAFAEKALQLVHTFLPMAYQNGKNIQAREKMHNAACIAGMAFNAAGLGLVHAMAHAIGGVLHIPHGKINAMLMPVVIKYNAADERSDTAKRYATCARLMGLNTATVSIAISELIHEIQRMNNMMKIPATLRELGADLNLLQQQRDFIIQATLSDACILTNPIQPSYEDIHLLIQKLQG